MATLRKKSRKKAQEEHVINQRRKSSIVPTDVAGEKRIVRIFIEENNGKEAGKATFKTIAVPVPCTAAFCKDLLRMKVVVRNCTSEAYQLVEVCNLEDLRVVKEEEDIVALMDAWPKEADAIHKLVYKDPSKMRRVLKIHLEGDIVKSIAVTGDMTSSNVCSLLARRMKMIDTTEYRVLVQEGGQPVTVVGMEENLMDVLLSHQQQQQQPQYHFKKPSDVKEGVVEIVRTPFEHSEIPGFEILSLLGKGGFGKVWKVRERASGAIMALKVLRKRGVVERQMEVHTKVEQQAMRVVQHPFVIRLLRSFQSSERLYLLMENLEGGTLFEKIRDRASPFREGEVRFFAAQIILAMAELHKEGFIYRDLKLENIMLDLEGNVRLMDFGLSHYDPSGDGVNSFSGTAIYLAPEILHNVPHGPMVDWWCFGVAMFLLLCQEPPFWNEDHKELFEDIKQKEPYFDEMTFLSPEALSLLKALLVKDPEARLGRGGADEVCKHPFFASVDWDEVLSKAKPSPFLTEPTLEHAVYIPKEELDDIFVDPADGAVAADLFPDFSFTSESAL